MKAPCEYLGCTLGKRFLFSVPFLMLFVRNHQMFSRHFLVCSPTVWWVVPCFEFLMKWWEAMAAKSLYLGLQDALNEGIKRLKNGMAMLMAHHWHILYVLVCSYWYSTTFC